MFDESAYRRANDAIRAPEALKARARSSKSPRSHRRWLPKVGGLVAAVLVLALALQLPLWNSAAGRLQSGSFASAAYVAEYPDALAWDDFYAGSESPGFDYDAASAAMEDYFASIQVAADYLTSLSGFARSSTQAALSGLSAGENGVYSPLALYMSLAVVAELSAGDTRQQILDALGGTDLYTLRDQTNRIWNTIHQDSAASQALLANSLWLNSSGAYQFKETPLTTLRDNYYTSTYASDMSSVDTLDAIHTWLDQQTGGVLSDQAQAVQMNPATVALLLSTVYFHDQWTSRFDSSLTASDRFTRSDGSEITCDFMHKNYHGSYVAADGFTAASLTFEGAGSMTFILPDEGVSVDDLLTDDALLTRVLSSSGDPDQNYGEVQLSVPKFSVSSSLDLIPLLQQLGITDLFDFTAADLTPLSDEPYLYIDRATQSTAVSIDEVGCTAASFVEMEMRTGSAMPDGLCVLDLDRPFLFIISGVEGIPLFVGVVNDPSV